MSAATFHIFRALISGLAIAMSPIFYRFCRALADAGHTMRTVFAPLRLSINKCDIVQRAVLFTFAAADA